MPHNHLHEIAQADTPGAVNVPNSWNGLLLWAVGRFGGGILIAIVCLVGIDRIYTDHTRLTERLLVLLEERAKSDAKLSSTLSSLTDAIDKVADDAKTAHAQPQTTYRSTK